MSIDGGRLWDDLMALAAITDPERPYTRRSFSPLFQDGRAWLAKAFAEAGLTVQLDTAGNLIGRRAARDPAAPPIIIGSHSDTVPSGGRFDGPAGILAGLAVIRALVVPLNHPIELIDFLAEEPSEYGVSCVGSRGMTGALDARMLTATNAHGETLAQAIARVGGDAAELPAPRSAAAYLELHIEQGPLLEATGTDLGIVTAIVGIARVEVVFAGAADHAGTTPMDHRHDAGLAAARLSLDVAARASAFAGLGRGHFVATTGIFSQEPNATNVVPGRARLVFDIRAEDDDLLGAFLAELDGCSARIATESCVTRAGFDILSRTRSTQCDTGLQAALESAGAQLGHSTRRLASGAGHDAVFLSRIGPMAMLFIPCRDGRSHTPEEWADPEALLKGAETLLATIQQIDQQAAQR